MTPSKTAHAEWQKYCYLNFKNHSESFKGSKFSSNSEGELIVELHGEKWIWENPEWIAVSA